MRKPWSAPSTPKKPRTYATGGGNATASGVNFQQSVGALFASWMLTEAPIDHRLQLSGATVTTIRLETEAPLDDALALTSERGIIAAQAKNTLSLSSSLTSEFGKTLEQIVRQWRLCCNGSGDLDWNRPLDPTKDRLLIVVGPGSPATLRVYLTGGLEARRQPGKPLLTLDETKALARFDACIRSAWVAATTEPLTDEILRSISNLTFVYAIDPEGADRAAMAASLSPALAHPSDALSVLNLLERVAGDLMSTRGGRNISTLRGDLIGRGARLAARPDYREDIAALGNYSLQTEQILKGLEVVEAEAGIPVGIVRHCQSAVNAAAKGGDLLLIGEPGVGKTAVLNALGRALRAQGHDVIELSVDRFSIESLEGLSRALRLHHDVPTVLDAWDGPGPAFLLIDALDASRGGSSEAAFKRLIEAVIELGRRWTVVASIRTFDLRLGQNFRALFKGTPPDRTLLGDGFSTVRHIQVPVWSEAEFEELLDLSPRLAEVLRHGPAKLRELATMPFNTRLLADLIASSAVSQNFAAIDTQISLLNLYWERRIERHGAAGEVCLRAVVTEMVASRALRAPRLKVAAANPSILDTLVGEGLLVLTDQQRSIQFRHHLLFDYVASRVFLDVDGIVSGEATFPKAQGLGLVLAPAMNFLLQRLWSSDPDHVTFWAAVSQLLGVSDWDPVIRSVAARMAAELPTVVNDILSFTRAVNRGDPPAIIALPHIAGAVAVRLEDDPVTALAPWVKFELELSQRPAAVAGILRMLGYMLIDRVQDPELRSDLGAAVRALLRHGFGLEDSRSIATPAINFVADTIMTDVGASVELLQRALADDRWEKFGPDELPALAHKINAIAPVAPTLAIEIYDRVFAHQVIENRQTSIGSGRILSLTSNVRQDFESARWSLKEYFPKFLGSSPVEGAQVLLAALTGYVNRQHPIPKELSEQTIRNQNGDVRLQPDYSYVWAREVHPQHAHDADALLSTFKIFLETGKESAVMAAAEYAVRHASLAVVWSRLFMAGAARGGALAEYLVRYAVQPGFIITPDTRKDAIDLVAARYDDLQASERIVLETTVLEHSFDEFAHSDRAKQGLLTCLFGTIGAERLATEVARAVVAGALAQENVNPRLFEITTGSIKPYNYYWMDKSTRAVPEVGELIAALEAVHEELHLELNDRLPIATLDGAISVLAALKARIDVGAVSDPPLVGRAEGIFAQGVHKLVQSDLIDVDTPIELIGIIGDWIETACCSSDPTRDADTEAEFERSPDWGSPSARLEAAEAVLDLCLKRPETYCAKGQLIDHMLVDPHPAVRMSAALRLTRIWNLDRSRFWDCARQIVATEENRSVLDAFVTQTLSWAVRLGAAREVADLVMPLINRLPASELRNAGIREHLVQMTLQFWLHFGFPDAANQVRLWLAAAVDNVGEIRHAILWVRNAITAGLRGSADQSAPEHRRVAMELIAEAVDQATDELATLGDLPDLTDAKTARARSAMEIIDTACQQLYFSSGAFQHASQQDAPPSMTIEGTAVFFYEAAPTIRRIGECGGPRTIYYLIQLLEHLVEADPPGVFDLIAFAVLQGGRQTGYQFEYLAADLIVKLIGQYLADHKEVFNDQQRRNALIDTLETFVAVGWPSVRRLFYRLPELLQ